MRLTKQTDFALRTLMYLAKQDQGRRVFAQEIAEAYDMPINGQSQRGHFGTPSHRRF